MRNIYYRPVWTCGRYNSDKHIALMYNLIAGVSFFFESYSADVIHYILSAGRNVIVDLEQISISSGIALESLQAFAQTLLNNGLLVEHIPTQEEITNYRTQIAKTKCQATWVDKLAEEKLPMNTTNAEKAYYEKLDDGCTICSCMFELTYRCSEKCIHCYNPGATRNDNEISRRGDLKELTLEDYKRIIDEMYELGLVKVCLSGGDPFSKEFVWEIIDYLYQKEIAFDIFTNGQRLLKDVQRLADYYPRLVGVSIYSGVAEDHDAITRVPGSWNRSMEVVKQLSALAIPMNLKCCVMQPNLHTYFMVADLANQYGAQPQYEINITESNDGDICAKHLRLTEEQLQVVLRDKNMTMYVGEDIPNYGGYPIIKERRGCAAATTSFCITPNGELRPCCSFPLNFGNINENSTLEILQHSNKLLEWRSCMLSQYESCGKFEYCNFCNLCSGLNYTEHNDFRKPAESNCYMAKIRYHLAQQLKIDKKIDNISMDREQFIKNLKLLPQNAVILQREYIRKG